MKTISIHSYRGGTGKSNVTANLAWWLARQGARVGVVDTDLQSPGVHMVFGFDTKRITFTLSDFLFGSCDVEETAYDVSKDVGLDHDADGTLMLLPSSMRVEAITRILAEGYDETRLHESFDTLGESLSLDYLLLDTHPGLNRETMLTTAISDLLLILLRPDTQDFHGTAVLLEVARRLRVPRTFLAANKVVSTLSREQLRKMVQESFDAELIGCIPLSEDVASLGSRGVFSAQNGSHPITTELRAITDRVVAECRDAD